MPGTAALGATAEQARYMRLLQDSGSRIGPFSAANYWAGAAGVGPEFQNNRTILGGWWREAGTVNNQTIHSFSTATGGWRIIASSLRTVLITFIGAGGGSNSFAQAYQGLNTFGIAQDGSGARILSYQGSTARNLVSPGAYNLAGGTGIHAFGKDQGNNASPATQQSLLWNIVIDRALNAAELQRATQIANHLNRWQAPTWLLEDSACIAYFNWADWDGVSATFSGQEFGGGASGYVMTRAGTGGGKSVMPAAERRRVPPRAFYDLGAWQLQGATGENGGIRHNLFVQCGFTTSAASTAGGGAGIVLDLQSGYWNLPGCIQAGLTVSGVDQVCNNNGAQPTPGVLEADGLMLTRSVDCMGIPAGANKPCKTTDGVQSRSIGSVIAAASVGFIRTPVGATFAFDMATIPTDIEFYVGDSLIEQIQTGSDDAGTNGPPSKAYPILQRAAMLGTRRVACSGYGFGTWHQRISTADLKAEFVALYARICRATNSNWSWLALGTNDYGLVTYASLAAFEADLTPTLVSILALPITNNKIRLIGPTTRTNEAVNNGAGWNMPGLRTMYQNVVANIANPNLTYVDASAFVSSANKLPDGIHYLLAGHLEYSNAKTALGPPP